mgnify:CR=1 FL=1
MVEQLNSCKAFYDYNFLQSYREVVAFYDNKHNVYYLYRYNSATTRQHFYKWFRKRDEGGCNDIFITLYKFAKMYDYEYVKAIRGENGLFVAQPCTPIEYYRALED